MPERRNLGGGSEDREWVDGGAGAAGDDQGRDHELSRFDFDAFWKDNSLPVRQSNGVSLLVDALDRPGCRFGESRG